MKTVSSSIALVLGGLVALVNLLAFSHGLNLKYVIIVLAVVGLGLRIRGFVRPSLSILVHGFVALAAAIMVYGSFSNIFVDDTGFVIRYMNMARQGCFYCYNVSDGPVFGISSIVYGILTCSLAMTGIASNESIIIGLNFLGLATLFFFLLRIFKRLLQDELLVVLSFALAVLCSTRLLFSATAGLETNVHLAIVFAGVYFFFADKRSWMWLFFGLAVVSKLDAVPLVVTLSLIHLFEKRALYLGENAVRNLVSAFLFAGLPIFLFLLLSFSLFDGPLPQSAYAKLYFHAHPSTHWFPFLELYLEAPARKALFLFALFFPLLQSLLSARKGQFEWKHLALFLGFGATMALYYFYNPVERMIWYYALPDLLLFAQLALSVALLLADLSSGKSELLRSGTQVLMFAALCLAAVPMTTGEMKWMDTYLNTVETERLEIGRYVAQLPAGDTLASAHGHFGANYKGYVLDLSGLNSKLVTDYHRNTDSLLRSFHPRYFINHATGENLNTAAENNYFVLKEWTAIEAYDYPKWVLWERKE